MKLELELWLQAHQTPPIKPLARNILLDSINWIMSEPSSTASISMDSFSLDDANQSTKEPEACFVNFLRPLSQRLPFISCQKGGLPTHTFCHFKKMNNFPFLSHVGKKASWFSGTTSLRYYFRSTGLPRWALVQGRSSAIQGSHAHSCCIISTHFIR